MGKQNIKMSRIWFIFVIAACYLFLACSAAFATEITLSGNETTVEYEADGGAIDTVESDTETIDDVISIETTATDEIETFDLHFIDALTGMRINNAVFYIDDIPYSSNNGVLKIRINYDDTSIHTVSAVADGYEMDGPKTFSFPEMKGCNGYAMVLCARTLGSSDSKTISYVIGKLKVIDFLFNGKLHMEDGSSYEYDRSKIEDNRGLLGKTIICTLENEIVVDFKEYIASENDPIDIGSNTQTKVYGKDTKPLTDKDKVLKTAREYNEAMNAYFESLGRTAQNQLKSMKSTSISKGKQLRALDEAKGASRILTTDAGMSSEAIDSAYSALSDFLDKYTQTGVELGKIDLEKETVEIEAGIIKKIINNIDTNGITRRKYGNYYVDISATSIWGNFTGTLTVKGKNKTYYCYINSDTKKVAQTMEDYLNEISDMTKDLEKQALQSIVDEFLESSYIGAITKTEIKKLFKSKSAYIKKYGFGEFVIDISNDLLDDYDAAKAVLELKDTSEFDDAMVNARTIYKTFEEKDYSFEDEFGTGEGNSSSIIEAAVKKLDETRNNFISALADYLYNTNSYDEKQDDSPWNSFVKIFINCPVEFELFNSSGSCVAYYKGNEVNSDNSSVRVEVSGDRKVIYIEKSYTSLKNIKLTAVDNGTMDYIVENVVNNAVVGRANYYDIPLNEGDVFTQNAVWGDASALVTENALMSSAGSQITANEYIKASEDALVDISCTSGAGGAVRGSGQYIKGETVTLSAMAQNGYQFAGWYVNNELESVNPTYRFTAEKNMNVNCSFTATEIIHPDYKAVMSREYREFAGAAVYKNKSNTNNVDVELRLEGDDCSSAYSAFQLKGYSDDTLVVEKSFAVDANSNSRIRLENIDLKNSEHIEIYDAENKPVAYVVYVPDYRNLEDLIMDKDMVLEEDVYCNNIIQNSLGKCSIQLNGHKLIVVGDIKGCSEFYKWEKEGTDACSCLEIKNGLLKVIGNTDEECVVLNQGSFIDYGNFSGALVLSSDDDTVTFWGDTVCNYGNISAGTIELYGNADFSGREINVNGTNKAIINGYGQQEISGSYNHVLFHNDDIVTSEITIGKLLSDVRLKAKETKNDDFDLPTIILSIYDSNGYNMVADGDVLIRYDTSNINSGKMIVNGNMMVTDDGIISVSEGTLIINGDFIGGEKDSKGYYYDEGGITLNKGNCHILGDFVCGDIFMKNEKDVMDIDGNLNMQYNYYIEDGKGVYDNLSAGTLKLGGDLKVDELVCTGTNKFIFEKNKDMNLEGNFYFNDLLVENDILINLSGDAFGVVNLLGNINIKSLESGDLYFACSYEKWTSEDSVSYKIIDEIVDENKNDVITKRTEFNGYTCKIEGNVDVAAQIDLEGGELEVVGNVYLCNGLIVINEGKMISNGNLYLSDYYFENYPENYRGNGAILMNKEEDLLEVHGDFCVDGICDRIFVYKDKEYAANPSSDNILPAISAGTIMLYGDVSINYPFIFTGTNKVVVCGNDYQGVNINGEFNQTEVNGKYVDWRQGGLGVLLKDAKIGCGAFVSLGNTILNGVKLEICSLNGQYTIIEGNIDIDGGVLKVDGSVSHEGSLIKLSNRGQFIVSGSYYNSLDDDNVCGRILMDSDAELMDVDGDFYYHFFDNIDNGTLKLAGRDIDILSGSKDNFIIGANVVLDGINHQYVDLIGEYDYELDTGVYGKFDKLTITQPLSSYTFEPNPCWNTLLDVNGNIIQNLEDTSQGTTHNGNNNNQWENTTIDENRTDVNQKVSNQPTADITISSISKKLATGKKVQLTAAVSPGNASNKSLTWTSSNPKYATVSSSGKVTLKKAGAGKSVTITATATDGSGVKAAYKIKIMKHAVKKVKIKAASKTVKAGKSLKLKATVTTTGKSANKKVKWISSNPKYATVSRSGKVTAKKNAKGKTVTITAMATDGSGKKAKVKLKIK